MKTIPLTQGRVALVDDADFIELSKHKWFLHSGGYAVRNTPWAVKKGIIYMHRVITGAADGKQVDHISGDKLDNRRANLRLATNGQNQHNQTRKPTATSPYKGVNYRPDRHCWRARIIVNGVEQHLGYFQAPEDAARAYDRAALELCGEFARLNFPNEWADKQQRPT